jgi:hypothetical protein
MSLTLVISGGQTGADQAGLRAAKALGFKTGGYAPKEFMTEEGPAPWLADYGLVEHSDLDYHARTELNVLVSDGTVVFGYRSQGSNLTERICQENGKPCLWLKDYAKDKNVIMKFRLWVARNDIKTINIAGNRESRTRGIGKSVERFLLEALPLCR